MYLSTMIDRCPVMLVAGDYSPHLNDTVAMNARLDPTNSTWMKVRRLRLGINHKAYVEIILASEAVMQYR